MSINSLLVPNNYPLTIGDLTTEDITATRITSNDIRSEDVRTRELTLLSATDQPIVIRTVSPTTSYVLVLPNDIANNTGKPLMLDNFSTGQLAFTLPSVRYIKSVNTGTTSATAFTGFITGTFTPQYPTSIIKVTVSGVTQKTGANGTGHVTLLRDGVAVGSPVPPSTTGFFVIPASDTGVHMYSFEYLDQSPVGVSVEYSVAFRVNNGADSIAYGAQATSTILTIQEIFAEAI